MSKAYFVHDKGICDSDQVGEGTRIWAFAHVLKGAVVGKNCNIGEGVFIESKAVVGDNAIIKNGVCVWDLVTLEDNVFVGPNAVFTNDMYPRAHPKYKAAPDAWKPTRIKEGATLGANCTVVCGNTIGRFAMIAAGAVVTRDVEDFALVAGVPGNVLGTVCYCGRPAKAVGRCECGQHLVKSLKGRILPESEAV